MGEAPRSATAGLGRPAAKGAAAARADLVRYLRLRRAIRSDAVAAAMLAVPREAFLDPDTTVDQAYSDSPVLLKRGRGGEIISTISQPTMIAAMLEQLGVRPGDRILEIGTASGYNAALLAHLTGANGLVVSIELEPDLTASAARALENLGVANAVALCADGRWGWERAAPYDRIVVTAAANRVEPAWQQQLRDGGRLVVPLDAPSMCFAYEKRDGRMTELSRVPAAFVPLRSEPGEAH